MPTIVRNTSSKPTERTPKAAQKRSLNPNTAAAVIAVAVVAAILGLWLGFRAFSPSWEPTATSAAELAAGQKRAGDLMKKSHDDFKARQAAQSSSNGQ